MSKRWIVILLFISLAFNLAVLGMFTYMSMFRGFPFCPPPHKVPEEMQERQIQRRDRDRLMNRASDEDKKEIRKLRLEFLHNRKEFMDILLQENFNEADAVKVMNASLQAQDKLEKKLGEALIEVRKQMTAEEAKEYLKQRMEREAKKQKPFRPDFDPQRKEINEERR